MFTFKKIVIVIFLCILALPLLQGLLRVLPEASLSGDIMPIEKIDINLMNWLDGKIQANIESWFERKIGLKGYFIRTDNQLNYWLFNEIHQKTKERLVVGKKHYLFEQNYIDAYLGRDKANLNDLSKRIGLMRRLQDELQYKHKTFLFVLAPSKASFLADCLPDDQLGSAKVGDLSFNYLAIIKELRKQGVNYWDGREYFARESRVAKAPLFARSGTHWTIYGSCLATEQILGQLGALRGEVYSKPDCKNIDWSSNPIGQDADLLNLTNLWFRSDFKELLAYPRISYSAKANDLGLLWIGDSFSWNILKHFRDGKYIRSYDFGYYFNTNYSYPDNEINPMPKTGQKLEDLINKQDAIIVESNEAGLFDVGWGFVEKANEAVGG